jgi:hypothetical protein
MFPKSALIRLFEKPSLNTGRKLPGFPWVPKTGPWTISVYARVPC